MLQMVGALLVFMATYLLQIAAVDTFLVPEELCRSFTKKTSIPYFTNGYPSAPKGDFNNTIYLAASTVNYGTDEVGTGNSEVAVGEKHTFVFIQYNEEYRDPNGAARVCSSSARQEAKSVLKKLLRGNKKGEGFEITPEIFAKQTKIFGNIEIYGKHEGSTTASHDPFYRVVKMSTHYLAQVPLPTSRRFNFYWIQFAPPLSGAYTLTMNLDFANCLENLAHKAISNKFWWRWSEDALRKAKKKQAPTTRKKYHDHSVISYKKAVTRRKALMQNFHQKKRKDSLQEPREQEQGDAPEPVFKDTDKFCVILLAKAVVQFQVRVVDISTDEDAGQGVLQAAKLLRRSSYCDLSDLAGSYWVYPPIAPSVPVSKVLQHSVPVFHHPRCPAFHTIVESEALQGEYNFCMVGDSNSLRTVQYGYEYPDDLVAPGISIRADTFVHEQVQVDNYPGLQSHNTDAFSLRTKKCMAEVMSPSTSGVAAKGSIVGLNIGHHLKELTHQEVAEDVLVPILRKIGTFSSPKVSLVMWATLASSVRMFLKPRHGDLMKDKFPLEFLIRSNSYREVLHNQRIRGIMTDTDDRHFGNVNANYEDILREMQAKSKDREERSRFFNTPYSFVDTFHPSLALGGMTHSYGDPVHFNCEYKFYHKFILQSLVIASKCSKDEDHCLLNSALLEGGDASAPQNEKFEYLTWNPVAKLPVFAPRNHDKCDPRLKGYSFEKEQELLRG